MSLTLKNLRAVTPGVQPTSLEPGQLCFNLPDRVMFVGDGSDVKSPFDGTPVPGVPGRGWFSVPVSFSGLGNYYVIDPVVYGDVPTNGQMLLWDASLSRVVWGDGPAPVPGNTAYLTSNAAVAAAPGVDLSSKISNTLGITPVSGDSVVVVGTPGDPYQAFYQFISGSWVYAASYAPPLASAVPVTPIPTLLATTVQEALEEILGVSEVAQTTASDALVVANNALPKTGGTMTGDIQFTNGQPVDAGFY